MRGAGPSLLLLPRMGVLVVLVVLVAASVVGVSFGAFWRCPSCLLGGRSLLSVSVGGRERVRISWAGWQEREIGGEGLGMRSGRADRVSVGSLGGDAEGVRLRDGGQRERERGDLLDVPCSAAPLAAAQTAGAIPGSSRSRACFFSRFRALPAVFASGSF